MKCLDFASKEHSSVSELCVGFLAKKVSLHFCLKAFREKLFHLKLHSISDKLDLAKKDELIPYLITCN